MTDCCWLRLCLRLVVLAIIVLAGATAFSFPSPASVGPMTASRSLIRSRMLRPSRSSNQRCEDQPAPWTRITRMSSRLRSSNQKDREQQPTKKKKSKDNNNRNTAAEKMYRQFLKSFAKGIAVPFPSLRNVVVKQQSMRRHGNGSGFTVGLSFREGLAALVAYLASGVIAYSVFLEKWSIVDSLYFTCVCFSTVGYGDLCPSNRASRIFTVFFGVGGIAFLGAAVAAVGGRFVEAEINAAKTVRRQSGRQIMHLFEGMPKVLQHYRKKPVEEQRKELLEKAKSSREELKQKFKARIRPRIDALSSSSLKFRDVILRSLPAFSLVVVGGLIMHRLNGHKWSGYEDAIYYALVTASTIGFGDLAPTTRAARMFAILFIPLSVAAAGELLSGIAMAMVHRRQREVYEKQLEQDLTIEHLKVMDTDEDGKITREEYVRFMLIEMGRVSQSELDELAVQFNRLDVTRSGFLDNEDLELMAKIRGATVKQ